MGRRTPSELRRLPAPRRRHGAPTLPSAAIREQRTPSWLKAGDGQSMAEAARWGTAHYRQVHGPRYCKIEGPNGKRKRRYSDQLSAARALAGAQSDQRRILAQVRERRVYLCPECDGWHLTSLPEWKPDKELEEATG